MTPPPMVVRLVERTSELTRIPTLDLLASSRISNRAALARSACWQVLHERGWTLRSIGEVFGRDHSTVSLMCSRSKRASYSNPTHSQMVTELRRVAALVERSDPLAVFDQRVRVSLWALEHEIAEAEALRAQIDAKLARARFLRTNFAAYIERVADPIPTRTRERGVA